MDQADAVMRIVAPWLEATDRLQAWLDQHAGTTQRARRDTGITLLRETLQTLARRGQAIAPVAATERAQGADGAPWRLDLLLSAMPGAATANTLRARREAVLRLSLFRVLSELHDLDAPEAEARTALIDLQRQLADANADPPPGLCPTLAYADGPAAPAYFNERVRVVLRALARRYPEAAAGFERHAALAPFEASPVSVMRWSRAWTAAVAGVYLDCLHRHADDGTPPWLPPVGAALQFRAPSELLVLPSRERNLHLELWTDLVQAQALGHDPARWQRADQGDTWHRICIGLHDLGESASGNSSDEPPRRFVRGLGIEMIYQAVFADAARLALQPHADAPAMDPADSEHIVVVELPPERAGHALNLQLAIRWRQVPAGSRFSDTSADDDPMRGIDPQQQRVIAAWQERRAATENLSQIVPAALLDWQPDDAAPSWQDECGGAWTALGHGRLWAAAGAAAQWLSIALNVHSGGRWQTIELGCCDTAVDNECRCRLLIGAGASDPDGHGMRALLADPRRCLWVRSLAGLGAFIDCFVDLDKPPAA